MRMVHNAWWSKTDNWITLMYDRLNNKQTLVIHRTNHIQEHNYKLSSKLTDSQFPQILHPWYLLVKNTIQGHIKNDKGKKKKRKDDYCDMLMLP